MKIIQSDSILREVFWNGRIPSSRNGYICQTVPHVKYHAFFQVPSLYGDSLLYCSTVSRYRLLNGHKGILIRPDFLSLRLVIEGSEYVRYNGVKYLMEAGDLMIFQPFCDYEYATGDSGFCEKFSVTVKGRALADLLKHSSLNEVFHLKLEDISAFREQYFRLESLMGSKSKNQKTAMAGVLMEILQYLSQMVTPRAAPEKLLEIQQYIEQHQKDDLSLAKLSSSFGLCASSINRLFRRCLKCSVHQYVMRSRMEKARVLMLEQGLSCKEIASECGFSSPFNFSTKFKQYYGLAPRAFLHRFSPRDRKE
mgnify:CR=1 FL=1